MNKRLSISIGISAYNEEANIRRLIDSLLKQKTDNFFLKEIIIVSDGSRDKTARIILSIKNKKIILINGRYRMGKTARVKQIVKLFKADIIFFIDADVWIKDMKLIFKIVSKFKPELHGLMSLKLVPINNSNIVERSINYGVAIQDDLRMRWFKGRNYLAFKGAFLGISKKLSREVKFPTTLINDDAFLFFSACKLGYKTKYFPDLKVFYKSPSTIKDHILQSSRFKSSKKELSNFFENADMYYDIPSNVFIITLLKYLFKNPIYFVGYTLISVISLIRKKDDSSTWVIATSTKSSGNYAG